MPVHAMKAYEGVEVKLQPFLTTSLDAGELSASRSRRLSRDQNLYERFGKETNLLHLTVIEPRFIGLASSVVTSQTLIYGSSYNVHNLGDLQMELRILCDMLKNVV